MHRVAAHRLADTRGVQMRALLFTLLMLTVLTFNVGADDHSYKSLTDDAFEQLEGDMRFQRSKLSTDGMANFSDRLKGSAIASVCGDDELSFLLFPTNEEIATFYNNHIKKITSKDSPYSRYLNSLSSNHKLELIDGMESEFRAFRTWVFTRF